GNNFNTLTLPLAPRGLISLSILLGRPSETSIALEGSISFAKMPEPITMGIIAICYALFSVANTIIETIVKFFKAIREYRLERLFKKMGGLIQEHKQDGYLDRMQRRSLHGMLQKAREANWKGHIQNSGQRELIEQADQLEREIEEVVAAAD
ncbi:uncharacterized protein EI97DRAFT_472539, partial [Westerdykella ornata]